jgi:hypothetical protein
MLSLTNAEAGKPGGITLGSVDKTELADGLDIGDALNIADHLSQGYLDWSPEAEWVLRAQHSRIEELEKLNAELKAYNTELHGIEHDLGIAEAIGFDKGYKAATAKTLTDEEILSEWDYEFGVEVDLIDFARAILKKASEK